MMPIPTSKPPVPLATQELDYHLPGELIATRPAVPRDAARLLVVRRSDTTFEHACVRDLPRFVVPGDLMVFNTTAVAAAPSYGRSHLANRHVCV